MSCLRFSVPGETAAGERRALVSRLGACCVGVLVVALLATGCASGGGKQRVGETANLKTLRFTMDANANDNRPARVELVRVDDENLIDEMVRIESASWFEGDGEAFRRANPSAISDAWELVPGLDSGPFEVSLKRGFVKRMLRRGKVAGVLFCDTLKPSPPLRVARKGKVSVTVRNDGCTLDDPVAKRRFFSLRGPGRKRTLSFAVAAGVNGNSPVRVAVVGTKDTELVGNLLRINGDAWFAGAGKSFRQANPEAHYENWEVVPGGVYPGEMVVQGRVTGVIFCGVPAAGAVRLERKDWKRRVAIEVDDGGCRLSAGGTNAPRRSGRQGE